MVSHFEVGTRCWQPDNAEGWVSAEVTSKNVSGEQVTLELTLENGNVNTVTCTVADLEDENNPNLPPLRNPPILEASEDLTDLSFLNEPAVMHAIKLRYQQLSIYTYSGIVLIATNPFQRVDALYAPDIIQMYSGKRRGELEPHLFAIAEDAYRCMLRDKKNQTIVVSGESGAGKTVSAKYIMRYFATVQDTDKPLGHQIKSDKLSQTEEQIMATNPIMEAFGNAKTTRNDNSSRFGKYIEILFNDTPDIVGAKIRTYLLERSRLVFQPPTERNYHIFYQLCAGATEEEREALGLLAVEEFNYLNQGGEPVIVNVNDREEFLSTKKALTTIGISDDTQSGIFEVLAGLLHLGNVVITAGRNDANLASNEPSLERACKLLGIDPVMFAKWTTKKQITTRSEKIVSNLNFKQATVVRDSVSKYIYSALFDWLVSITNNSLASPEVERSATQFIGVLDIYGFEYFKKNSFEQFCINYANEKLQQEFNQHVFKLEQEEYVREDINWSFIEFSDNQPCISLIEAKIGILSLLDEESRLPSGSDDSLVNKLYANFDVEKHKKFFKKPRFGKTAFTINHYAMEVTYDSDGFIEKNRDTVPDEHLEVLLASKNKFLTEILQASIDAAKVESAQAATATANSTPKARPGGRPGALSNRKPTLGGIFKASLIELMNTINSTNVHYIRCIKPNEQKEAWKFEGPMVLSQLRACGVLETIRISCEGFPTRWTFEEFVGRYYMLVHSSTWEKSIQEISDTILNKTITQPEKYQLGKTKIFFRAGMLAYLENLRSQRLNDCAVLIQKNLKRLFYRNRYLEIRNSVIAVQSVIRARLARSRFEQLKLDIAVTKIQSAYRGFAARRGYHESRRTIIQVQSFARGFLVRNGLLEGRQQDAARKIQRTYRGFAVRKDYTNYRRNVILVQSLFRRRQARKELQALKIEARSVNHFKQVSYALENKVVELTQNLATRTQDNKKLSLQIEQLESQLASWQLKHDDLEKQIGELELEADGASEHLKKAQELEYKLADLDLKHEEAISKINSLEVEADELRNSLSNKSTQLDEAINLKQEKEESEISLNEEIKRLKEEVERLSINGLPVVSANGFINTPKQNNTNQVTNGLISRPAQQQHQQQNRTPRSIKRHSVNTPIKDSDGHSLAVSHDFSPRPASMAIPPTSSPGYFAAFGDAADDQFEPENVDTEIEKILENSDQLHLEVLEGLIRRLKVPQPAASDENPDQVLFPAHMVDLISSEMWRIGFVKDSEVLWAGVMQTIQQQVMSYRGEDIIVPGAFWLSNVHEMLSFVYLAESSVVSQQKNDVGDVELEEYILLLSVVKHDLENLEFNIYHTWMKELKKILYGMIIPAVIESQSLPGFTTSESTRFFNKLLNSTSTPLHSMDDLLKFFNRIHRAMEAYFLEYQVIKQVVHELLKLVGVTSFNDLLSRRNFLSWKRGLQISYNITRIEEWCKSHDVADGPLKLEHLMQATKLLQLKKATIGDIEIIYDICWTLSPTQIQKLISQYHVADYEHPISPEILKAIASKALQTEHDTLHLEAVSLDDSGPYEIADPRELTALQTYLPSWLPVPTLKRLVELTARNASHE
ncbi:P-loop containing nucleoside triphosphate hydrolase protein [Lipomyces japonicus]|uniref:P-loop containing nucleoside triphosphate hydrolase protein n=1 Tax=Lipomyces japonicus TaxID=56871 RepID=UPI0034CED90B